MYTLTIHNLDEALDARLRQRAAAHGQSMEEEALSILRDALAAEPPLSAGGDLIGAVRALVDPFGGIELELPPRGPMREPPDFDGPEFGP